MSKLTGEIIVGDRSGCDGEVGVGVWPWKAGARPDTIVAQLRAQFSDEWPVGPD